MPRGTINHLAAFPRIIAVSDIVNRSFPLIGKSRVGWRPLSAPVRTTRAPAPQTQRPEQAQPLPVPSDLCLYLVPARQSPALLLPCWRRNFFPIRVSAGMQRRHKLRVGNQAWLGLWEKAEHLSAELSTQQPALFSFEPLGLNFSAKCILIGIFLVATKSHASFGKSQPVPIWGEKCANCKTRQVFQDGTSPDGFSCFLCQKEEWLRARAFYGESSAPCHSRGPQGQDWDKRAMAGFKIRHFPVTGDPDTSKLKDFCCSLETSAFFSPEIGSLFP